MKNTHTSIIAIACCVLFCSAGCEDKTVRNVRINVGSASVHLHPDHLIVVNFTGHEVVIEKERLLVDKIEVAKVSSSAMDFDITVTGSTLTVKADGMEILKTELKK